MSYVSTNNEYNDPEYDYLREDCPGYEQRVHYKLQSQATKMELYPFTVYCDHCGHGNKVDEYHAEYIECEECHESVAHLVCSELQDSIAYELQTQKMSSEHQHDVNDAQ